jgi:hypothetical protein
MLCVINKIFNLYCTVYYFSLKLIVYNVIVVYIDILLPAINNLHPLSKLIDIFYLTNKVMSFYYNFIFNYYFTLNLINNWLVIELSTISNHLTFLIQVFFLVVISIWARAAGPRFRVDQLSNLTWKNLLIYLSLLLIFLTTIYILN